jgi:hypothetical protein
MTVERAIQGSFHPTTHSFMEKATSRVQTTHLMSPGRGAREINLTALEFALVPSSFLTCLPALANTETALRAIEFPEEQQ